MFCFPRISTLGHSLCVCSFLLVNYCVYVCVCFQMIVCMCVLCLFVCMFACEWLCVNVCCVCVCVCLFVNDCLDEPSEVDFSTNKFLNANNFSISHHPLFLTH